MTYRYTKHQSTQAGFAILALSGLIAACGQPAPSASSENRGGSGPVSTLTETCGTRGFECGEVAGMNCGACDENEICVAGTCHCKPTCDGTSCDDGCGGVCQCPAGMVCDAQRRCVQEGDCTQTCASENLECGEVCGESCGACDEGHECREGRCVCVPDCDGTHCGDDGCGGTCECSGGRVCADDKSCIDEVCSMTCDGRECGEVCGESCGTCEDGTACVNGDCAEVTSCDDCTLRLVYVASKGSRLQLALEYTPQKDEPRPRMIDVRVQADEDARLVLAQMSRELLDAGKRLVGDPRTGAAWMEDEATNTYRFLFLGTTSIDDIEPGRLLTLEFDAKGAGPFGFGIVKKDQVFAPGAADAALQRQDYGQKMSVSL